MQAYHSTAPEPTVLSGIRPFRRKSSSRGHRHHGFTASALSTCGGRCLLFVHLSSPAGALLTDRVSHCNFASSFFLPSRRNRGVSCAKKRHLWG